MTKKEQVVEYIKENIKKQLWNPGEKIPSEPSLAQQLNMSRMSVREGIEVLANNGILRKKKGSGTYVNEITPTVNFNNIFPSVELEANGYIEILEARMGLEPIALELSMKNNSDSLKYELENILLKMKETISEKNFIDYDMEFHQTIAKYSENRLLINIINIMGIMLKLHKKGYEYNYIDNSIRIEEHEIIVDAILRNEIEVAKIYLHNHLKKAIEKVRDKVKIKEKIKK